MTMLAQFATTGGSVPAYIEDVFSTWLYTGNGANRSIDNGIDLSTKGGLVWTKGRTGTYIQHALFDTVRGTGSDLISASTSAAITGITDMITAFNTNGYSLGTDAGYGHVNFSGQTYASWTFRKQPKFFDVVTYTGNGSTQNISHSLGSVPGCIIVKQTSASARWVVYHRSLGATQYLQLDKTAVAQTYSGFWNDTSPTSTSFTVGNDSEINGSGQTYVAYIFAHNAGGFGLTGSDNVISCGSYTVASNVATVTLGYEPQFTITKCTSAADDWRTNDVMRGSATAGGQNASLQPNTSNAESAGTAGTHPTATGFTVQGVADGTYIYIAIRRGPMKVPTDGTKVFAPTAISNASGTQNTIGFPTDLVIDKIRGSGTEKMRFFDRLRGIRSPGITATMPELVPSDTTAEAANGSEVPVVDNTSFYTPSGLTSAYGNIIFWNFRRAPSFFDEVCFTGTGSAVTVNHNLQAVPELMIVKCRSVAEQWLIYHSALGNTKFLYFTTGTPTTSNLGWNNTSPTSTQLTVGAGWSGSGVTLVAYLFATCAGVSKVGSYTGTATTQQINCGFSAGARFVLIKRTDSTGDWYVWDSARGIVAGNDPYLLLNSTAAEVTTTDYVDTYAAGFELSSTAPAALNASGGTYIFLAIA